MKKRILLPLQGMMLKLVVVFAAMFSYLNSFAQDKQVDINVNTKSNDGNFFTQPWVWIVGGAVFILLLVALLRGNKSSA
jgi:hypothetical protein